MAGIPATMSRFWTQVMVGAAAFNERDFSTDAGVDHAQRSRWGHHLARQLRYQVYWAHYEQNVYRTFHLWAETLKKDYQLYSAVRSVYSPAYRIGEFWAEHVYGGVLDPRAGDGVGVFSAIPVRTENPALRSVLACVWRWSNWQSNKDAWARFGAVLGDAFLMVVDDPARKQVYLKVIHPRIVREFWTDPQGNCKGYVFEERRPDPRMDNMVEMAPLVTYTEVCTRVGDRVRFQTYLDGAEYDWHSYEDDDPKAGTDFDWHEDYGFVPLVHVQHRNVGSGWGMSEYHTSLSKMMELDDIVSKLDDQIRKLVDCPWLFSGVPDPSQSQENLDPSAPTLTVQYASPTDDSPTPERTSFPAFYASDPAAKAQSLVAALDVAAVSAHAQSILRELERDHPEIQEDSENVAGDASGRSRRVAREKTESRVVTRRQAYDDALVRAHMMAVSVGAQKEYPDFAGFTAASFGDGDLDHSIGDRPVFAVDTLDHLEEIQARATVLQTMVASGVPVPVAMLQAGYPVEVVKQAVLYSAHLAASGQPVPTPKTNVKGTPTTVAQADPANATAGPSAALPQMPAPGDGLKILFGTGP